MQSSRWSRKGFRLRKYRRNSRTPHCQVVWVNILSGRRSSRLSKLSIGSSSFAVSTSLTSRLVDVLSLFQENDVPSPYEFTVARSTVNILLALENESRFRLRKLEGSCVIGLNEGPFHLVISRCILLRSALLKCVNQYALFAPTRWSKNCCNIYDDVSKNGTRLCKKKKER